MSWIIITLLLVILKVDGWLAVSWWIVFMPIIIRYVVMLFVWVVLTVLAWITQRAS